MIVLRAQPRSIFVEADSGLTFSGGPDYADLEAADISAVLAYAAQLARVQSVELLSA